MPQTEETLDEWFGPEIVTVFVADLGNRYTPNHH